MNKLKFKIKLLIRKIIYVSFFVLNIFIKRNSKIIIFCYHSFSNDNWRFGVSPKAFESQLKYLIKNYEPISLDEVEKFVAGKMTIEKDSFVINIDDGYKDIMAVREMINSLNIKPTVFLLSDIKKANYKELDTNREFLSKEDISILINDGWTIGSHGATHSDFYNLTEKQIKYEVYDSKNKIEKELGIKIKYFAYPKGSYTKKVLKEVKDAGYALGLSMNDGFIKKGYDPILIPRVGVDRTHSLIEFKGMISIYGIVFRKFIKENLKLTI